MGSRPIKSKNGLVEGFLGSTQKVPDLIVFDSFGLANFVRFSEQVFGFQDRMNVEARTFSMRETAM